MYRPDRIGPWPLVTLDGPPIALSGVGTAPLTEAVTVGVLNLPANRSTNAVTHVGTLSNIAAGNQGAVGISILGDDLGDSGQYICAVSGTFLGFTAEESLAVVPVIGRVKDNGAATTTLEEWAILPPTHAGYARSVGTEIGPIIVSINMEVILGDWLPVGGSLLNEIFFGFWMVNGGVSAIGLSDTQASMSIHRYESDLNPFDPNR